MPTLVWLLPVFFGLHLLLIPPLPVGAQEIVVGHFSAAEPTEGLPQGWEPLTFDKIVRHTHYALVRDGQSRRVVIEAHSDDAASGLMRRIRIDPGRYPTVKWCWKIGGILAKGDVTRKKGDDYPARLYIAFEYDPKGRSLFERAKYEAAKLIRGEYPPAAAITYIWANKAPTGTITPNAYTDRAQMMVVASGSHKVNTWVCFQRNLLKDYRAAFGGEPPAIAAVAIMTDTDNTGEKTTAWYGDIVFAHDSEGEEAR